MSLRTIDVERTRALTAANEAAAEQARKRMYDDTGPEIGTMVPMADGIDAADLLSMDLPDLKWIVPGILPEGTSLLVAPPKVGKSCLIYQMAVEVSIGGELFGQRVASGSVLYLALEDGMRRGRDRLRAALGDRTLPRGRLDVRWTAPLIGDGLEEQIATWLDAHTDAALVALDTLGRVRPRASSHSNAYDVDVKDIARLQDIFRDRDVAFVIVHHVNKGTSEDSVSQVSGTHGLAGTADTILNLTRKRSEAYGTLTVTGRDVADNRLAVRFDAMTWHAAPDALGDASIQRIEVFKTVQALQPTWPKKVADKLDLERSNVQHQMTALVNEGTLMRTAKGYVVVAHELPYVPTHSSHSIPLRESEERVRGHKGESDEPLRAVSTVSERFAADIGGDV